MRDSHMATSVPGPYRDGGARDGETGQSSCERGDHVAILAIVDGVDGIGAPGTDPTIQVLMGSRDFGAIVGLPEAAAMPCSLDVAAHLSAAARHALAASMQQAIATRTPLVRPFPLVYGTDEVPWTARPWATLTPVATGGDFAAVALRIDTRITDDTDVSQRADDTVLTTAPTEIQDETWSLQRSLRALSTAYAAFSWKTDREGRIGYISEGVARILGYEPEEMIGRRPTEFMPEDEVVRVNEGFSNFPHQLEMPMDLEHKFLKNEGGEIWVRVVMIPVFDPATGIRLGHHGLTIDISDRKEAEKALGATVARHYALFEAARDAIIIIDLESGTVIEANRQASLFFGRSLENLVNHCHRGLFAETEIPRLDDILSTAAAQSTTIDDEVALKCPNGSLVPAAIRATSVTVEGRPLIQLIMRTLEDRISYERQLRQERYSAQAANRSKTEFLANMSHELRTPLNAIIGFSEVLEQEMFGTLSERQKDYVADILDSGRHLLEIINSILDLSKIEVGKFELAEHVIDIGETVGKCLALVRERAVANGVHLDRNLAANLPYLRADPVRIKQILLNLLSNAVKFTGLDGRVKTSAMLDAASGDMLIEISDTGIGMTQEEIRRAMQPFTQVNGDRNRRFEGTGLGLSLAQRLCEQHGGSLEILSAPQVGTRAIIRLPSDRLISIENVPATPSHD